MSNYKLCKGKHLRIEERLIIEYGLDQNYTLKEIAERVGKDPTTISKEIKRNRFLRNVLSLAVTHMFVTDVAQLLRVRLKNNTIKLE